MLPRGTCLGNFTLICLWTAPSEEKKLVDIWRFVAVWVDFACSSVGEIIPFLSSLWRICSCYLSSRKAELNFSGYGDLFYLENCPGWSFCCYLWLISVIFALQMQTGTSTYCNGFVDFMWGNDGSSECRYMLLFAQVGSEAWDLRRVQRNLCYGDNIPLLLSFWFI